MFYEEDHSWKTTFVFADLKLKLTLWILKIFDHYRETPYNTKKSEIFKIYATNFNVGSTYMNVGFHEWSSTIMLI